MHIHQLSIRYLLEHDRIQMRVNTTDNEELQLWLTRRMTLQLWPVLNQLVIDQYAIPANAKSDGYVNLAALDAPTRQLLTEQCKQETLQNADFQTPYRNEAAARPLGDAPLLVTEVTMSTTEQRHLRLNFKEQIGDDTPRACQMELNGELVFGLLQLMEQALAQSQWSAAAPPAQPADDGTFADPSATRPTYLN